METHRLEHRPYDLVVIAASLGGVQALGTLLSALPADFPVPIAIVQHRTTQLPNLLPEVLCRRTSLKVKTVEEREALRPGTVYLAPPDLHFTVRPDHTACLSDGRRIRHVLSSANPLFESAAETFGGRVLAVVLTGFGRDGTDGVQAVKAHGGTVIAQDRATSQMFGMPASAIATGCVSQVLPLSEIGPALVRLVAASGSGDPAVRPPGRGAGMTGS
jgi:two-component system chemotaxis response regulator CheB